MRQRSALVRFLAIGWAIFQLASPSVTAIADGRLAIANAAGPSTHIESTTTATCPQVHSPDCAICRYLSGPVNALPPSAFDLIAGSDAESPNATNGLPHAVAIAQPPGRGPPPLNV